MDVPNGGRLVKHLDSNRWAEANRMVISKAIAEFSHERILNPKGDGESEGLYSLISDDGRAEYRFHSARYALDHWVIDQASITCVRDGERAELDVLEFISEFRATLGIDSSVLPVYIEELSSTLAGAAYKYAKALTSAGEIAVADFQTIESAMTEGHPCFLANNGRLGFGVADYHEFAPETGSRVRLGWLAVRAENVGVATSGSVTEKQFFDEELGPNVRERFAEQIARLGLDASDYQFMPVHPWQWGNKIAVTFAAEVARRDIIYLGESVDEYQPQQSIRTFFNTTRPQCCYVKTSLSILNMGFMRGLSAAYMAVTPAINDWVHDLIESDVVLKQRGFTILREIASIGYRSRCYEAVTEKGSPYRMMLAALWRESPVNLLGDGERLATMASLLHVDRAGASVAGELIRRSGIDPKVWLRRYLDAYLIPVLHCVYAYELTFMPHGENVLIVLRDDVPTRVFMKDIGEEVVVMGSRVDVPEDISRIRGHVPAQEMMLAVHTDVLDGFLRFLAPILAEEALILPDEFWEVVAEAVRDYQVATPELADRFAALDFFASKFPLVCLNRLQLRNNQRMVDLADVHGSLIYSGMLANPVAGPS